MKRIARAIRSRWNADVLAQQHQLTASIEQARRELSSDIDGLRAQVAERSSQLEAVIDARLEPLRGRDSRLDDLRTAVGRVEHYQPLYGVAGIVSSPARESRDRCETIHAALGDVTGLRILDIGSSLGFVSFFLADRGAAVQGWDLSPDNVDVARRVSDINGIAVDFKVKSLDPATIGTVAAGRFDVAIALSVFHHIVHFQGLDRARAFVAEILDQVPRLVVELALRGEDPELYWDAAQPANELELFDSMDVTIEKIGEFGTHLSTVHRPLYLISRPRYVTVNNKRYVWDESTQHAYPGSPMAKSGLARRYYFSAQYIIKEYRFSGELLDDENVTQIMNEIAIMTMLNSPRRAVSNVPRIVDFEAGQERAIIVIERFAGELAFEKPHAPAAMTTIVRDILQTLADLEAVRLYHNDVRSWNIIVSEGSGRLIDFGLCDAFASENNKVALLWAIHAMLVGQREPSPLDTSTLPDRAVFLDADLGEIYDLAVDDDSTFAQLLDAHSHRSDPTKALG